MPVLFHDFESRSTLDLRAVGAWRYASADSSDALCCAFAVDDGPIQLWIPGDPVPPEFIEAARNPDWITSAFGDHFERLITQHIMAPRYGWPLVPIERRRCSQASALALALPAALKDVARALELEQQKDDRGHRVMMQMARPRRPHQDEDPEGVYWFDDAERRAQLYSYCKQDVATERDLYRRIGELSGEEQVLWQLDSVINARGVYVDGELLDSAIKIAEAAQHEISVELQMITEGAVESIHQTAKLMVWLASQDCIVTDVQKATLKRALTRKSLTPGARRALELRLDGAHAAAAKLLTMRAWRNGDGRARGTFRFHGASTGRWTSFGIQAQNMKRPLVEDLGAAIEAVASGDLTRLRQHYPQPMSVVGDLARAMLCAAPGHRFIAADFSGIESRVTAWISGQQSKLDQWARFDRTGNPEDEPYFITGIRIFGLRPEIAREPGKTGDLAFGYMGGPGAWKKLAPPDDTSTEAEIKRRQQAWRNAHPQTVKFWGAINRTAIQAVRKPGIVIECGRLAFKCDGTFLRMKLPSGRKLAYPFPKLQVTDRGDLAVVFMDSQQGKWAECRFGHGAYGGIWIENAVQAIARDLFAAAMLRLEAAGYPIVLHVHDEIVAEVPNGIGSAEEFLRILTLSPDWASGLPIAAKVRNGPRFCKTKTTTQAPPIQPEINISGDAEVPWEPKERTSEAPIGSDSEHNPPQEEDRDHDLDHERRPATASPRDDDGTHSELHWADMPSLSLAGGMPGNTDAGTRPQTHEGVGAHFSDGSKAEAEQDTYAQDHAGEPFSDAFLRRKGYQLAHVFDYTLADRALLYQQNRYELKSGIAPTKERPRKKFLPHRSVNGKDILGAGDRRVIYNWPAIMRAGPGSTVFVPEGENKAKILTDNGLLATTVISHKWAPECVAALTGHHLIILQDHDKDGEKLASNAQRKLAPVAASTRIVPATHLWKHLPGGKEPKPHDDVVNWIDLGGDPKKLLDICREIPADGVTALECVCAADEEMEALDWIWPGRFALGKLGLLVGLPDEGKGLAFSDIMARITRGSPWPCDEGHAPLGNVVLLTAEDDTKDTVTPRLAAAGADLRRVTIIKMAREAGKRRMFSLVSDLEVLRQKVVEIGDVKMILIDPITAYLGIGKVDSFRATDVRAVLGPLVEFAGELRVSILAIMHFNKKIDVTNVLLRISDSLAYGATARHAYAIVDDLDNHRKLLVKGKNNLAPRDQKTLAFSSDAREVGTDKKSGKPIIAPYIVWHAEPVDITATEAMQAAAESKSPSARENAKRFLEALLSDGPVSSRDVVDAAKANGIAQRTLHRAKNDLGVDVRKDGPIEEGERTWQWHLATRSRRNDD